LLIADRYRCGEVATQPFSMIPMQPGIAPGLSCFCLQDWSLVLPTVVKHSETMGGGAIKIPTSSEEGARGFSIGNRKSAIDNFYQSP